MSKCLKATVALVSVVFACASLAQSFPEPNTEPPAAELRTLLTNKSFDVKTARGSAWRIQIKDNGTFDITVGTFEDSGDWTAEDGKWCTRPRKGKPSCNEMRVSGGSLYMKRDNGEIVQWLARP